MERSFGVSACRDSPMSSETTRTPAALGQVSVTLLRTVTAAFTVHPPFIRR
jgi:hypothetical protein